MPSSERVDITDGEELRPTLAEPFTTIIREANGSKNTNGNTHRLSMSRVPGRYGGPYRARTDDIHGVNVALYQLS